MRRISVEKRKKLVTVVKDTKRPNIDLKIYFHYNSATIRPKSMPTMIKLGDRSL